MTAEQFKATTADPAPPAGIGPLLVALWHDARGDWEAAHAVAQADEGSATHDRLHAYLHRKEGDAGNAAYWYRRARVPVYRGTLEDEWRELVDAALA